MRSEDFLGFFEILDVVETEASNTRVVEVLPQLAGTAADVKSASAAVLLDEVNIVLEVRKNVDELYAQGRNTVMGDEELEVMVRRANVERYERLLFHKSH